MALQTPERPKPQTADTDSGVQQAPDVDAGVIEDARARQRRQRVAGVSTLLAAAALAALLLGLTGGGGTGRPGAHGQGHAAAPAAGGSAPSRAVGTTFTTAPPGISQIGLLAPGVGWVATDNGLYVTRNGGRSWVRTHVPGLGGDATAGIAEATSSAPNHAVLVFNASLAYGACPMPSHPGATAPINAVASTSDTGRKWHTHTLSSCIDPYALSFVSASSGLMAAWKREDSRALYLYATSDGGQRWHRVARLPFPGTITFASAKLGLGLAFWSDATTGVAGTPARIALYRTTDGGSSWQRQRICSSTPTQAVTIVCQLPIAEGPQSFYVPAVVTDSRTKRSRPIVYATTDAGRTWTTRRLPAIPAKLQHGLYGRNHLTVPFSAPDAQHLFMLVGPNLYRSTDGGRSWTRFRTPFGTLDFASASYGWDMSRHLYYTTDGGRSWRRFKQR